MQYKHSLPIQLRLNDTDALGHVNNSAYFTFYDLGKTGYFNAVRGNTIPPGPIEVVVAHIEVDFLLPVFLHDEIAVQTTVEKIGNKSFVLLQRLVCTKTETEKCVCRTIMCGFDFEHNCAKPIPEEWRKAISQYENKTY